MLEDPYDDPYNDYLTPSAWNGASATQIVGTVLAVVALAMFLAGAVHVLT